MPTKQRPAAGELLRRRRRPSRPKTGESWGRYHNLQKIFERLNERYFQGQIKTASIGWSRPPRPSNKARNSIKFGSYNFADRVICVHPALDQKFVPRFFVEYIIFHEMLHGRLAFIVAGGRRLVHTPKFLAMERTFRHFHRAQRWEARHLDRLLRYKP